MRYTFISKLSVTLSLFILLFTSASCSSPKSDGEEQAREECEMWDDYVRNTVTTYTNFVKEFGSKNYQSRTQARKDLNACIDEVETKLSSQLSELDIKYTALLKKYEND